MNKTIYAMIMIFFGLIVIGMVGFTYLSFFHITEPVTFNNEPVPIWQDGENICFEIDYTRHTTKPVQVTRVFRDGIMFATNPIYADGNVKGRQVETICYPIPSTLPNGEYFTTTDLTFQVNPFATRTVTWVSQKFNIVKI